MQVKNAIRKLEKSGFTARQNNTATRYGFSSPSGRDVIEFHTNSGSDHVTCIKVRGVNDHDDCQQDYSAGVFVDNMAQAIRLSGRA